MDVYYSDPFGFPLPPTHRFPLAKYALLRERVEAWPAATGVTLHLAPRASRDELLDRQLRQLVDKPAPDKTKPSGPAKARGTKK